ncbi:uncharacterized protein LOC108112154 [Drosophila eugracilis]|uniref:uncharacterized protein LOC108112154 n=1 Tax=Drosophila eugracilis TaxID=29029 RepID=UPI0007E85EB7|nr:uncharacterized protein LOC108112154 [Drosophila eugracilis]
MERDRVSTKVCNIFHSSRQMAMEKRTKQTPGKAPLSPHAHTQKRDCYLQNPRAPNAPIHTHFTGSIPPPTLESYPFHSKKNF